MPPGAKALTSTIAEIGTRTNDLIERIPTLSQGDGVVSITHYAQYDDGTRKRVIFRLKEDTLV